MGVVLCCVVLFCCLSCCVVLFCVVLHSTVSYVCCVVLYCFVFGCNGCVCRPGYVLGQDGSCQMGKKLLFLLHLFYLTHKKIFSFSNLRS